MPFGYYTLLRAVFCLTGAVGLAASRRTQGRAWPWVYAILAILYNPILPVRLGARMIWIMLNLASLVFVWIGAVRFRGALARPGPRRGGPSGT